MKTARSSWVDAGLAMLARSGVDAVRVEVLARELGVTKGGFYGTFEGRDELVSAMLQAWEHAVTDSVIARVEEPDHAPRERLRRLLAVISEQHEPATRIETELAIRDWARRDRAAASVVARVDAVRSAYLRDIFLGFCSEEEAEARTAIAMSVRLAAEIMPFDYGTCSPQEILDLIMVRLLA